MRRSIRNQNGTTLIELTASAAIMAALAISFYQMFISFHQNYQTQEGIAEMRQQGRVAIDLLTREIQSAGYDPSGTLFNTKKETIKTTDGKVQVVNRNGAPGCDNRSQEAERILEAAPTLFHYLADLNGDGNTTSDNDKKEEIRYEWVGAEGKNACGVRKTPFTLYRDTGGRAQEVALNIVGFNLEYWLEDGRMISNRSLTDDERPLIRKIVATLQSRTDRRDPTVVLNGGYRTRTFRSEVWLKNME